MAANEFEKNVQRIMDELRLHPSEGVWENVEKSIREQKRKRRIIFFIILSCIGLGLAGYGIDHLLKPEKTKIQTAHQDSHENSTSLHEPTKTASKQTDTDASVENRKSTEVANTNSITKRANESNHLGGKEGSNPLQENDKKILLKKRAASASDNSASNQYQDKRSKRQTEAVSTPKVASPKGNNEPGSKDSTTGHQEINAQPKLVSNKPADSEVSKQAQQKLTAIVPSTETIKTRKRSNKAKLKWGVTISSGISTINGNFPFLNQQNQYYPNAVSGPGAPGVGYVMPQSSNRSSFAFQGGITVNKKLSRRSALSVVAQYSLLSDKFQTGANQASSSQLYSLLNAASYYVPGSQKVYTDRFHFIEFPIVYDIRITSNSEHFVGFDAGVSPTYLVATNALVYDTVGGGIYYHNKRLFSRAGLNLIVGIPYHIMIKDMEMSVGPKLSFGLNKIIKSDLDKRKYFLFGGINATILFGKSKK